MVNDECDTVWQLPEFGRTKQINRLRLNIVYKIVWRSSLIWTQSDVNFPLDVDRILNFILVQ